MKAPQHAQASSWLSHIANNPEIERINSDHTAEGLELCLLLFLLAFFIVPQAMPYFLHCLP